MSHIHIFIHAAWATKDREPLLEPGKREIIFEHIRTNADSKGIRIDAIGGHHDHVHCFIRMLPHQRIGDIIRELKGDSESWVNGKQLIGGRLQWHAGYHAVSVSGFAVENVRRYIVNQQKHHRNRTFEEEAEQLFAPYPGEHEK